MSFKNSLVEAQAILDDFAFVFIKYEQDNPHLNGENELNKDFIYSGKLNRLMYNRYFNLNLRCNLKFKTYPFDQQNCAIWVSDFYFYFFLLTTTYLNW